MTKKKRNIIIISVVAAVCVAALVLTLVLVLTKKPQDRTYTVTFNSNGGTVVAAVTDIPYDTTIAEPAAPVREGYVFEGWFKESALENAWKFDTDTVKKDVTLYAKWRYNPTDGFEFKIVGSSAIIVGIGTAGEVKNVVIPSIYGNLPVTSIADGLFRGNGAVETVYIPESVTSVGNNLFRACPNLVSVTFAGESTALGSTVFYDCQKLVRVTLPKNITMITAETFYNCLSLKEFKIPSSVTEIQKSAFQFCAALTEFALPDKLTTIGEQAFAGCSALTAVNIPSAVTSIGELAFSGCYGVESMTMSPGNTKYFGEGNCIVEISSQDGTPKFTVIAGCKNSNMTSISSSTPISAIGVGAFSACRYLTNISIPSTVTSIGDYAFQACDRLQNVTIPASVKTIGKMAFAKCNRLQYVRFLSAENGQDEVPLEIGKEAFYDCITSQTELSISLPKRLAKLGEGAFWWNPIYDEENLRVSYAGSQTEFSQSVKTPVDYDTNRYKRPTLIWCTDGNDNIDVFGLA